MKHKLSAILLSTGVAIAFAASASIEVKESLTVPETAQRAENVAVITELGTTQNVPMRVPEGGYTAPVTFAPTQEQFDECLILDINEDGKKWHLDGEYFKYDYSTDNEADDWCILPTMNLEAGTYKITYTYKTKSYKENFRMCIGNSTTPESMTIQVMEKIDYLNSNDVTESRTVELPTGGEWHIGLYAFSDANMYGIYFKNISVVRLDAAQPKGPELSVEANGLEATLSITLPTQTLGGTALTATTVNATTYLDGEPIENGTVSGAPGDVKTVQFTATSGAHSISAIATVTDGDKTLTSEASVIDHTFTKAQPIPTPMGYTFEPDNDEFSWCTVINSNEDNNTWDFCTSGYPEGGVIGSGAIRYAYSWTNDADDWIIFPAFDGAEAGARMLTFNVATKYSNEGLEVCVAYEPTVEALSQNVVWKNASFQYPEGFESQQAVFSVEGGRDFYVAFHAISPRSGSYMYIQEITVDNTDGNGPQAGVLSDPTFDGGDGTVKLTLPEKNLDGQTLSGTVYADITLDGEAYGETIQGTPGEAVEIPFSGLSLGYHTVTATTYTFNEQNEKIGNQTTSIEFKCRISSSFAYQLPLAIDLNSSVFDNFLIVNANNDAKTWEGKEDCFQIGYTSNSGDDWFITPAVEINDITTRFDIAVTARGYSTSYPEAFEVFLGREQSVEGMTIQVMERTVVTSDSYIRFENNFELTEPGRYYIGVHGVSDPDQFNLMINKIELAASAVSNDAPAAVSDLSGDGVETGELKAEISFAFPTLNAGGAELDATTALTATVFGTSDRQTVEGKPGETASVTLTCPEGKSTVYVFVTSESGEGVRSSIEVNCGLDRPTAPVVTAATISEDNMSVLIEWNAITTGVNGGHVNPDGMDYYLFEWDADDEDWYQVDVTEGLSLTYSLPSQEYPMEMITLGLQAYNGLNSGSAMTPITVVLGNPLELPMTETFEQGNMHYTPLCLASSLQADYAPEWAIVNPSTIIEGVTSQEGGFALYGHTSFNRGDSEIIFPKFSTENIEEAEIELSIYYYPSTCEFKLYATAYGIEEPITLGEIAVPQSNQGWKQFKFALAEELLGKKWVEARLFVNFNGGSSCIPLIDSYKIRKTDNSAVDNVAAETTGNVSANAGNITITGFEGSTARIFTTTGILLDTAELDGSEYTKSVAAGIYIVSVGNKTYKVAVD